MATNQTLSTQAVKLIDADGYPLGATLYPPENSNGRVVLINSAMGVKRGYYHKYATFLASKGFTVLTYDYRGVGDSRQGDLRKSPARLLDWGEKDQTLALQWLLGQYPDQKLLVVGHSVGGQILGLTVLNNRLDGVLTVASQSGYWRHWPGWRKYWIFVVWHFIIPGSTALLGYFPASKFGLGEDLPAGVAREWARGGRSPRYIYDFFENTFHNHYPALSAPFRSYSFEDDTFAPEKSVDMLLPLYPNAKPERIHLKPSDLGVDAIAHFGFFRDKFKDSLWQESANWLAQV